MSLTKTERQIVAEAVDDAQLTATALRLAADEDVVTPNLTRQSAELIDGLCELIKSLEDAADEL